jgi:N-formylglutamate deformylase
MSPVTVLAPPAGDARLVFDSPHSGRFYPPDWHTKTTGAPLRRGEDAYVDELLEDVVAHSVVLLLANYPRCYIDVNRELRDIDAELLAEPWPEPLEPSEKTRRGLGLIRRYVTPGVEVNDAPLAVADVMGRIERVYRPYHQTLRELLDAVRSRHGVVWHVNWHSMKSVGNPLTPDGPGAVRPDVVVGDRDGASAAPELTEAVVETLRGLGYRVAVNDPYKGGTIVARYGRPADGVHSVQVELNRALYLEEARVVKNDRFAGVRDDVTALAARLERELAGAKGAAG